jgi:RNA polymerase sigma-70 factor (ECF subfamily)
MLAALIARTSAGDRAALEALYDETSALVYSVALRILRDAESAGEVVIDVFARLAQRAAAYDPARGGPTTWLVMQARTQAIDRYRVQARTRAREIALTADMENEIPAATEDGAEASARRELERAIRAALALLTAPQRRVIEIAFYSGLSQSEIALALGEPLGTVKTRIRTAMRRLRDLLGPTLEQLRP